MVNILWGLALALYLTAMVLFWAFIYIGIPILLIWLSTKLWKRWKT